jgi:hypothetical protein
MPAGGYDLADTAVETTPRPKKGKKNREFVQADGGDDRMHAVMLGADDQFVTVIPAVPVKG